MNLKPRTYIAALIIAIVISIAIKLLFELPDRPFTAAQLVLLYLVSLLPSLGLAMLTDPAPKKAKEEFSKINFYEQH